MPVSAVVFDHIVGALILQMAPASILDIGPGAGKYGLMITALREQGLKVESLAAVEIDESYIETYRLREIYDLVQPGDAANLPDVGPDAAWDLVILGDVLEHLRKSRGVDLVEYLYYRTKFMVLVVPIDYIQGAWDGHHAEAHISTWYAADFARYKATCLSATAPTGAETQLILINGLRTDPAKDFVFARDLPGSGIVPTG